MLSERQGRRKYSFFDFVEFCLGFGPAVLGIFFRALLQVPCFSWYKRRYYYDTWDYICLITLSCVYVLTSDLYSFF